MDSSLVFTNAVTNKTLSHQDRHGYVQQGDFKSARKNVLIFLANIVRNARGTSVFHVERPQAITGCMLPCTNGLTLFKDGTDVALSPMIERKSKKPASDAFLVTTGDHMTFCKWSTVNDAGENVPLSLNIKPCVVLRKKDQTGKVISFSFLEESMRKMCSKGVMLGQYGGFTPDQMLMLAGFLGAICKEVKKMPNIEEIRTPMFADEGADSETSFTTIYNAADCLRLLDLPPKTVVDEGIEHTYSRITVNISHPLLSLDFNSPVRDPECDPYATDKFANEKNVVQQGFVPTKLDMLKLNHKHEWVETGITVADMCLDPKKYKFAAQVNVAAIVNIRETTAYISFRAAGIYLKEVIASVGTKRSTTLYENAPTDLGDGAFKVSRISEDEDDKTDVEDLADM